MPLLALRFAFWAAWGGNRVNTVQAAQTTAASGSVVVPVAAFGGAPRPFFSYSEKKLAWTPKQPVKAEPIRIAATVAVAQPSQVSKAVGRIRLIGHAKQKQRTAVPEIRGVLRFSGTTHLMQMPGAVTSCGDMLDMELLYAALLEVELEEVA